MTNRLAIWLFPVAQQSAILNGSVRIGVMYQQGTGDSAPEAEVPCIAFVKANPFVRAREGNELFEAEQLNWLAELQMLEDVLGELGKQVDLLQVNGDSSSLSTVIHQRARVMHFIGHGGQEGLNIEDDLRGASLLPPHALRSMLHAGRTGTFMKLAFLGSCVSFEAGSAFVNAGVPHVVATKRNVPDATFRKFGKVFYTQLLGGGSVQGTFTLAKLSAEQGSTIPGDLFVLLPEGDSHDEVLFPRLAPGKFGRVGARNIPRNLDTKPDQRMIGRGSLLEIVRRALVSGDCRFVRLWGCRGSGATSSALCVSHYLYERSAFPDGVVMVHLQPWSISARSSSSDRSREGGSGGATTYPSTASTPPPLSPTLRRTMTGEPAPLWRQVYAGLRMAGVDGFGPSDPEVRSQRDLFSLLEGKRILLLLDGVDAYQGRWRHRRSPSLALDPTPAPRPTPPPPPPAAVEGFGVPVARRRPATGGAATTQRQRQQTRFVEPQRGHMRRERSAIPRTDRLAVPDSMQRSRSAAAATDEYDIWKFFNTLGRKTNGVKVLFTSVSSEGTMPDIRYPIKSIEMSPLSRREMANILVQNLSSSIVNRQAPEILARLDWGARLPEPPYQAMDEALAALQSPDQFRPTPTIDEFESQGHPMIQRPATRHRAIPDVACSGADMWLWLEEEAGATRDVGTLSHDDIRQAFLRYLTNSFAGSTCAAEAATACDYFMAQIGANSHACASVTEAEWVNAWDRVISPALQVLRDEREAWELQVIQPFLGRAEAQRMLSSAEPGAFLIRLSSRGQGSLALSYVCDTASLQDGDPAKRDGVVHSLVWRCESNDGSGGRHGFFVDPDRSTVYRSLAELIRDLPCLSVVRPTDEPKETILQSLDRYL